MLALHGFSTIAWLPSGAPDCFMVPFDSPLFAAHAGIIFY
jgi:hypothetical protein